MYARGYSLTIGHQFTSNTIRLTALTGAAATEIGGETTAREFALMTNEPSAEKFLPFFSDTRFSIVDEISFMTYQQLSKLSNHMQSFTECTEHKFGKHAIVFLGDFCQLECIGGDCIYLHENSMYWEQALTHLVELKGTHRFSNCALYSGIMPRLREGEFTEHVRNVLNSRVINGENVCYPDIQKTKFATFHNKNRAELNAVVFKDYLNRYHKDATRTNIPKTAIVIRAKAKWFARQRKLSLSQRATLFTYCSEADCKDSQNK